MYRRLAALLGALLVSSCTLTHVRFLSDDRLQGRDNDTPGSVDAQAYLIDIAALFGQGLNAAATGDDAYRQVFRGGTNILAVIPGTELADEYVIVGAHYDHLGSDCEQVAVGDTICNGATDNAAGVAAVLEVGRILSAAGKAPRRSVILAFWDRNEDGLLGSAHYVANPLAPLGNTVAYINLDILGSNLLPSLRQISFAVGAETGGATFAAAVGDAIGRQPLQTQPLSRIFGRGRSDDTILVHVGVPSVFFTDGAGPCNHTTGDDLSVLDMGKLNQQIAVATDLVMQVASGDLTPRLDGGAPRATYADAVALDTVLQLASVDFGRFDATHQSILQGIADRVARIVSAGEARFDARDVRVLIRAANQASAILATGECDGFLPPPSGEFDALSYNVAGLPASLSQSSPDVNTPIIGPLLNAYDLVLLQESWKTPDPNTLDPLRVYHEILEAASTHSFKSVPLPLPVGTDPLRPSAQLSDGLNRFTNFASTTVARRRWVECEGLVDSGADCLALKGFSHSAIELAPGVEVDVYNLHLEAGAGAKDDRIRAQDIDELVAYIQANSTGRPLIVGGDFNLNGDEPFDAALYAALESGTGLVDACSQLGCADTDAIDRFFFRSSEDLTLAPISWQFETATFVDGAGEPLSDHDPLRVRFAWSVPE